MTMEKKSNSWKKSLKRTFGRRIGQDVGAELRKVEQEMLQQARQEDEQAEDRPAPDPPKPKSRSKSTFWKTTLRRSMGRRIGGEVRVELQRKEGDEDGREHELEQERNLKDQDAQHAQHLQTKAPPATTAERCAGNEMDSQPVRFKVRSHNPFAGRAGFGRRDGFQLRSAAQRRAGSVLEGDERDSTDAAAAAAVGEGAESTFGMERATLSLGGTGGSDTLGSSSALQSRGVDSRGGGRFATWSCCSRGGGYVDPSLSERERTQGSILPVQEVEAVQPVPLRREIESAEGEGSGADTAGRDVAAVQASEDVQPTTSHTENTDEAGSSADTLVSEAEVAREEGDEGEDVEHRSAQASQEAPHSRPPTAAAGQAQQLRHVGETAGHLRASHTSGPRSIRRVTEAEVEAKCRSNDAMLTTALPTPPPKLGDDFQASAEENGKEAGESPNISESSAALVEEMGRVLRHAFEARKKRDAQAHIQNQLQTTRIAQLAGASTSVPYRDTGDQLVGTRTGRLAAPEPGQWLVSSNTARRTSEARARSVRQWIIERERRNRAADVNSPSERGDRTDDTLSISRPRLPVHHDRMESSASALIRSETVDAVYPSSVVAGPSRPRLVPRSRQLMNRDSVTTHSRLGLTAGYPHTSSTQSGPRYKQQTQDSEAESDQPEVNQRKVEDRQTGPEDDVESDRSIGCASLEVAIHGSMESVVTTIYRGPEVGGSLS